VIALPDPVPVTTTESPLAISFSVTGLVIVNRVEPDVATDTELPDRDSATISDDPLIEVIVPNIPGRRREPLTESVALLFEPAAAGLAEALADRSENARAPKNPLSTNATPAAPAAQPIHAGRRCLERGV